MKKIVLAMLVALMALAMVPVNAEVVQNERIPIEGWVWSECTGEDIYITGEVHLVYTITEDGAGGYHVKWHENLKASGVAEVTGNKYQLNEVLNEEFNAAADSIPYEITYVGNYGLIGQGKDNNLKMRMLWHVTVNANGEVTAEVENYEIDCQ